MKKPVLRLTESAVLLGVAVLLSILKLFDLPYGGSVTLASTLPVVIIAYRWGVKWGLLCGFTFSLLQLLLGMSTLQYATSIYALIAIILLDYLLAFSVFGLAGVWRKTVRSQAAALALGALTMSVLRFVCHFMSGMTVWAGLSIPSADSAVYSLVYNAAYMLPEMIILTVAAYYVGHVLDFRGERIRPLVRAMRGTEAAATAAGNAKTPSAADGAAVQTQTIAGTAAGAAVESATAQAAAFVSSAVSPAAARGRFWLPLLSKTALLAAAVWIIVLIAPHMQNEAEVFDVTGIVNVPWGTVGAVAGGGLALGVLLWGAGRWLRRKKTVPVG